MFGGFFANIQSSVEPVNPLDYSPLLWLDARVGVVESGGLVSSWADQSGNGNDAIQLSGALQPIYSATSFDGVNAALSFSSEQLQTATLSATLSSMTFIIVAYWESIPNGSTILGQVTGSNNDKRFFSDDNRQDTFFIWDGGTSPDITVGGLNLFTPFIITAIINADGTGKVRYNNDSYRTGSVTDLTVSNAALRIGNWGGAGSRYFNGKIAQLYIKDSAQPDGELDKIMNYFNSIYSIF